tara:strand:+ start:502 stop:666 length:165 start_codon:yes stop_codon:yes gene_type:complete
MAFNLKKIFVSSKQNAIRRQDENQRTTKDIEGASKDSRHPCLQDGETPSPDGAG